MIRPGAAMLLVAFAAPISAEAAPSTNVRTACESSFQHPTAVRQCIRYERAAKQRLERARTSVRGRARAVYDACGRQTTSWHEMETCVQRGGPSGRFPGGRVWGPAAPPAPRRALGRPAAPSQPIPESEAERHLRGVLEREGETDATCSKKQYGTGWATVCE